MLVFNSLFIDTFKKYSPREQASLAITQVAHCDNVDLYSFECIYMHLSVYLQGGVMQTHDEETRKFFKHSSIICVLSPRYASSKLSIFKQQVSLQA